MHGKRIRSAVLIPALLVFASACTGSVSSADPAPEGAVPGFALLDANPDSPSFARVVSPRDHLGHLTAWYFGGAT